MTVISDRVRRVGGCCAGFLRHELSWHEPSGGVGRTEFETWVQDHVVLRPEDSVSLLFKPGELAGRKRVPMPLLAVNHTLGQVWALPGACAVEPLR